jgi:NAD(P)-dependent dehydrogenase (short-subunit alcohol dehydrogenase family)
MATALVTGGNRGIGLAFVKLLLARGDRVLAVCRSSTPALADTGAEVLSGVDVTNETSVAELGKKLAGRSIDILINNAGILSHESLERLDFGSIQRQMDVNAYGPLRVTEALLPLLKNGSKLALITSRMGSIGDNGSGGYYGYRMSKAALNAAGKSLAVDLKPRGIAVAILHPGMVKTEMTGSHGKVDAIDAVRDLLKRIDELNLDNTGSFWHANGEVLPW